MNRKFNYFYQLTNKVNGNFYYGVHKTDNLEDNYMGSGKRIQYALRKYGLENFKKEILEFFNTYEEALDFESEIVNEDLILDSSCYNLTLGGGNGFNEWFSKQSYHIKGRIEANKSIGKKIRENKKFRKYFIKKVKEGLKKKYKNGWKGSFFLRKHSEETKKKMSLTHKKNEDQKGRKNSMYGKCWIYNEKIKENKVIKKKNLEYWLNKKWKKGRKIKM